MLAPIRVTGGEQSEVALTYPAFTAVLPKGDVGRVEQRTVLPDTVSAPIRAGEAIGQMTYHCHGEQIGEVSISAADTVEPIGFWSLWKRMLCRFLTA